MLVINKKIMGMTLLTLLLVGCGNNQPKNAQIGVSTENGENSTLQNLVEYF